MTIREEAEQREAAFLAPNATLAAQSRGRERDIPPATSAPASSGTWTALSTPSPFAA